MLSYIRMFDFEDKKRKEQRGTILLLALFILSGMIMVTSIIANIIIREIRLGRDYQNALSSLLGAESMIEEALYMLRIDLQDPLTLNGQGILSNGVSWNREAYNQTDHFIYDFIDKNDRIVLNVYNKANLNSSSGAESLKIQWKTGAFLDVTLFEWDGTTLNNITPTPLSFSCSAKPCNPILIDNIVANKAYQVIVEAKTGDATDLFITAHSQDVATDANKLQVAGPITINSTASFAGVKQAIQIGIAQRLPWE